MKQGPMLCVVLGVLLAMGGAAEAQIHRWVDDQGRVHYSNLRPVTPAPPESPDPVKGPTDPKTLIDEALEVSGARKQLLQIPAAVEAQVAERRAEMKPADYTALTQIIAESYRAETLYQGVRETFKSRFDEPRLLAARQAFSSPLFRKISDLEAQAGTPEATPRIREFVGEFRRQPPSQDRVALVRRVDEATGATDVNLDALIATVRGIALALDPLLPPEKRLKAGQLEQLLAQMRTNLRPSLNNEVLLTLLYAYRTVPDEDLRQYLEFLESDTGRWFNQVFREGLLTTMAAAAENAGKRMGKTLPAAPSSASLDAQKSWALATSAILTERNGQRHDLLGGTQRTEASIREWKQTLRQWWDINGRADLLATLKWLEEGGHRQDFEQLGALVKSLTPAQYQEIRAKAQENEDAAHKLQMVEKYYPTLGKKSLLGWDYARYISLCRWGYLVGYLTEDEAWERIMPAAQALQRTFNSWKDLGENYLIGREFWSLSETEQSGQLYREAYQSLLNDPASPWQRNPWNTNLQPARANRALRTY